MGEPEQTRQERWDDPRRTRNAGANGTQPMRQMSSSGMNVNVR
jgi:hypothetical protein